MSTSESTIKGKFDEAAGKVKQAVGEAIGNEKLANQGAVEQVKGHAEQSWGAVKEATNDKINETREREQPKAEQRAHDIREKVTSTAQNVKEHIQHAIKSE
ncbi:MAG: CsbD family protein [Acidobacteriaceae bacterium]|nr:CsbD family protein [Acidobacteriaceae bacterium]